MPAETIPELLAARAATSPIREAIVSPEGRIDFATLDRLSAARAALFVERGVNKTHRVGLLMQNGIDWAINAFALMRIGAVLVPLSTLLRPNELATQLGIAGVRHLVAAKAFRGRNYRDEIASLDKASLPSLRNVWWADELGEEPMAEARDVANALTLRVCPADDLAIVFTSGSRAAPRGIIHTHGAAIRAVAAGLEARCISAETRLYIPMPFFWIGGLAGGLLSALIAGATLLTEAEPEPGRTLAFLESEKATLFRGWPDQAAKLARHPDFASADLGTLCAGSLNAVLPGELQAQPGARANLFGMTETFGPYSGWRLDEDMPQDKWESCGKPFAGRNVRVADPDSGAILPAGETGSIQVGGHDILRGICGVEREDVFTPDGWYDTGDMGHVDADGFLWFTGRRDDMVKVKGATVYPSEVEAALEAIPGVDRAFATGLDLKGTPAIGAAVVPDEGEQIDEATLASRAKERLSAFKLPSRWAILDSLDALPRNTSGKVDKARLQSLLMEA